MTKSLHRSLFLGCLTCLSVLLFWAITTTPVQAHWADMSAAELVVNPTTVQMTLTLPTGLIPFADDDRSGQLSAAEIRQHANELQTVFNQKIQLKNTENQAGTLTIEPIVGTVSPVVQNAPNSHSTLRLIYTWPTALKGLNIRYGFFLPGVPSANCLATILQNGHLKTFVFTPKQQTLALSTGLPWVASGEWLVAIAGAFVWGAVHSLSPGHGKTVVGAYLMGERATPQHALFLAITTTITHTLGVFALGFLTLFAARYVLSEQLYPWLSLLSGGIVMGIGVNLLRDRLPRRTPPSAHTHSHEHDHEHGYDHNHGHNHDHDHDHEHEHSHTLDLGDSSHTQSHDQAYALAHGHTHDHSHDHHEHSPEPSHMHGHSQSHTHDHSQSHTHDHSHNHTHDHSHDHSHRHGHSHSHGTHSHLPPGTDGSPVTWQSLLALGISGGLVPCPAALVLLLSAIALGNTGLGLTLVLAFSFGLAAVLITLGLLLVYAKKLFQRFPTQMRRFQGLPIFSAGCITLIGLGISIKAFLQVLHLA